MRKNLFFVFMILMFQLAFAQDYLLLGTINSKIPVSMSVTVDGKIVKGEIRYLNTEHQKPITIIGKVENGQYRLMEFEKSGNVTGIIDGKFTKSIFTGSWFSPKTTTSFPIYLVSENKKLKSVSHQIKPSRKENIYGKYHYGYSDSGPQGMMEIKKIKNKIYFHVNTVTANPARNIADIEGYAKSIDAKNRFHHKAPIDPYSPKDECEFSISFYKDFAKIESIADKSECGFGHNAHIDGIYLKTK